MSVSGKITLSLLLLTVKVEFKRKSDNKSYVSVKSVK